jgi:PAS domain-containing protein
MLMVCDGEWEGTIVGLHEVRSHFIARVAMTPERSEDGMPIGFLAMSSEIVEDVMLDVELHRTPAHAHSALASVPDATVIVSARDEVQFANAEAAILLGDSHPGDGQSAVEMLISDRYLDLHPGVRMGFFSESWTHPGPGLDRSVQNPNRATNCYVHKRVEFQQCCDVMRTMRLLWHDMQPRTTSDA